MSVHTIPDLFLAAVREFPRPDCFSYRDGGGRYVDVSSEEALRRVMALRRGLQSLGVQPGDRVAILSENRIEWALADLATLCAGAVTVPIYPTLLPETIAFILKDCTPRAIFLSTEEQARKVGPLRPELPFLKDIVAFDPMDLPGALPFAELLAMGGESGSRGGTAAAEDCAPVDKDSPCSIIYTSGTTGNPKGVVLSHWNFVSNVQAIREIIKFYPDDKCLSFLPLSHVLERMAGFYSTLSAGVGIAYAQRMDSVPVDILDVKPTILISVPRLYEKIYAKVLGTAMAAGFPKKNIFFWARNLGIQAAEMRQRGRQPAGWFKFKVGLADHLVFKKLRGRLGGRVRFMVSGGAPLNEKINKFFNGAGLTILEGYGLTETSPVLTCNIFEAQRFGSVGKAIPRTEIRIADDGEILARGPQVMLAYYNNQAATHEVLDGQGWFATGDIGKQDQDGFLYITDRKKDLIVTAGGKNIAPQPIENALTSDKFVTQSVVIGDRRPYLTALIVPNLETVRDRLAKLGVPAPADADLLGLPQVQEIFAGILEQLNLKLPGFSQVKKFSLLPAEFTLEGGELTPTLKVKRFTIAKKYAAVIDGMYPASPEADQD